MEKKKNDPWGVLMFAVLTAIALSATVNIAGRTSTDSYVLQSVANQYGLNAEQTKLLFAIRNAEGGGPGREMGVLLPEAMRYKGDHQKSLRLQAEYAAGTIKKRWDGNIENFADRWCPSKTDPVGHNNWIRNVSIYMRGN
jgi:hypothetical protein